MQQAVKRKRKPSLASWLRKMGFDRSYYDRSTGLTRLGCSQCEALAINGVATHERGCSNQVQDDDDE